ncbi:MAG: endonuclease/exonuclease/phosphatase family protein [Spirochaetaceae bacterium]|jgi:endonuclease/exonuclease/phosphatase family metal-dependent hydrolase|nr:endonuclease/exonuclease/phosphatase family protein [Spirochaetaceae bacterium]
MEKIRKIFLLAFIFAGCDAIGKSASEPEKKPDEMRIAFWNVQALFDGEETGAEYGEYLSSAGWTAEKYQARLTALALGIEGLSENAPDIIGLAEIENAQVLADFAGGPLAKKGYQWTFFGANPGGALGVGVLSKHPFGQTLVHAITADGVTAPRPMLEIRLEVKDAPLICFVCHWKSKIGGDEETEAFRKASARVIARRLQELNQESPEIPVIVMGDLNENHDEFYRKSGSVITALLPDDPSAAELAGDAPADVLVLSLHKPPLPEYFSRSAAVLYTPWGGALPEGSYYFRETWETIDHFLLSPGLFDQTGWDFSSFQVIAREPFLREGKPHGYNPRTGGGLSDHLPLLLTIALP